MPIAKKHVLVYFAKVGQERYGTEFCHNFAVRLLLNWYYFGRLPIGWKISIVNTVVEKTVFVKWWRSLLFKDVNSSLKEYIWRGIETMKSVTFVSKSATGLSGDFSTNIEE
ncbi:uncharacterized protein [Musca autumnalis]|uniref:uncharacterized protein n=1 Tax=Musca autumnalis TaxID=221902 RepID=UPI003CE9A7E7